ncbi:MAG TPA: alanine--tRNA ligase [Thermoplasmata archaeon]|nr:alanine--tRNA ligase [Thermoplasmata archaeon]
MDEAEYRIDFFSKSGMHRRRCPACGHAFWTTGSHERCQEAPCTPYQFIGHPGFSRPLDPRGMREAFLGFFERRGHPRLRRYPVVARWRNDVFFTQASIYDFQPWVTSGELPPPANPLAISQPCLRFLDLDEVGRSGRHFTLFEMMAHHAFNRPDHPVYFKDRCVELCHEFLTAELGATSDSITYKEEEWEGGGNLGPSLSVGIAGLEVATLVFMEYVRDGAALRPMPLTVVDTGYGLERLTWLSQGTKNAYEAVFGAPFEELRRTFPARESAILVDHARALNFLLTDGVVPSNAKEGYFSRLLIRRMLRLLAGAPEAPEITAVLDRVARETARDFPEIGEHRDDLHTVVRAEVERYGEALDRAREQIRRVESRRREEHAPVTVEDLLVWYDSLGVTPEVAVAELSEPIPVPEDFYAQVARRHEAEPRASDYAEAPGASIDVPSTTPPTDVRYYLDPYTFDFEAHVLASSGHEVVLDRTYFYPTGGGQITDLGQLGEIPVVDVVRRGPWVVHRLDRPSPFRPSERVRGRIDAPRRTQLMQHHTATHLLNGALRTVLGPHVWQAGAHKAVDSARIDITHFRALSTEEVRRVERLVNRVVREDRAVKSYFEPRTEAERRFGFTLYQGGAVPGRELRIVEIDGFDVEACGGTHCTHTSEVGLVTVLGTERIQDGIVRLTYAAGERALDILDARAHELDASARALSVSPGHLLEGIERMKSELDAARRRERSDAKMDVQARASALAGEPASTVEEGGVRITRARVDLDRAGLMELSRRLTDAAGRVAILGGEEGGRGLLFVGSSAPTVAANEIVAAAREKFGGRGGGNPSAATALGEPGAPLAQALEAALAAARKAARGPSG